MKNTRDLQQTDIKNIWHPCSQMKDYEDFPPIIIDKGEGVYLTDKDGNTYIDAISSWWVNLFGHANKRISNALSRQAQKLEHVIFANFSHEPAIELSEAILDIAPKGLEKICFGDNGSSAIEIAIKLSFQYHQQSGKPNKTRFIALTNAYHGETLGALSLGGVDLYNQIYKPLLLDVIRANGPNCYRCPYGQTRQTCSAQCFDHMQNIVEEKHDEISAVVIEPMVQCASGMNMYSEQYLKKLRLLCDTYDIHLICDEVAVGFGRTGKMFAVEHADITPDMMCVSKGLTGGYLPLSLVITKGCIYDAFYDDYNTLKAFFHSHSYSGSTLGCAVAVETLKIFKDDKIIENNIEKSKHMEKRMKDYFSDLDFVGDIRHLGMIGAIELVKDKNTKEPFDWKERVGYHIYRKAVKKGVLLRPIGNILYFIPPYIINHDEIDKMIDVARTSTKAYFNERK